MKNLGITWPWPVYKIELNDFELQRIEIALLFMRDLAGKKGVPPFSAADRLLLGDVERVRKEGKRQ